MAEARNHVSEPSAEETDPTDPEFSLITGTLRSKKTYGRSEPEAETVEGIKDLTLRNQDFSLSKLESAGSEYIVVQSGLGWIRLTFRRVPQQSSFQGTRTAVWNGRACRARRGSEWDRQGLW